MFSKNDIEILSNELKYLDLTLLNITLIQPKYENLVDSLKIYNDLCEFWCIIKLPCKANIFVIYLLFSGHILRFESNVKQGISLTSNFTIIKHVEFESNVKQGISLTKRLKARTTLQFESNVKQGISLTSLL